MKNLQKSTNYSTPPFLHRRVLSLVVILGAMMLLSGCGALTGLPGHGGGKRFAVEQELVAASTRGALKQIDLSTLKGKKVNLFVNAIGDTGNDPASARVDMLDELTIRANFAPTSAPTKLRLHSFS